MTNTNLLQAMGRIDPKLIADAAPDVPQKKSVNKTWVKWASLAACLCLVVALLPLINSMVNTETPDNSDAACAPAHFYLDGNVYFFRGVTTQELPEGYECIGEVINVGDTFTGNDYEGNVDGKIYMNKFVADTAYFSWAEWNEEVDGPAPFLKFELEITE